MFLQVGDIAPDFTQTSTHGPIALYRWIGNAWALLFWHAADFTPVCTTELRDVMRLADEFAERNVKLVGLAVDSLERQLHWSGDVIDVYGIDLNFPLVADADRRVARAYRTAGPRFGKSGIERSVFVIDPRRRIRLIRTYSAGTQRGFCEVLRAIDSLQLAAAAPLQPKFEEDVLAATPAADRSSSSRSAGARKRCELQSSAATQPKSA